MTRHGGFYILNGHRAESVKDQGYKNVLSGHRHFMYQKKIDEYREIVEMDHHYGKTKETWRRASFNATA
jgi:hypothetical protein